MTHLIKKALSPSISILSNDTVERLIKTRAPYLFNEKEWKRINNFDKVDNVGVAGEFGYQKTNDDVIFNPLIYLTEIHTFRKIEKEGKKFCVAILTVEIDNNGNVNSKNFDIQIRDYDRFLDFKDILSTTLVLENGNVVQYGGWKKFEEVKNALEEKLEEQNKK